MSMTLEIRNLSATVAGEEILNGVDLTIHSGEVHAVMGPILPTPSPVGPPGSTVRTCSLSGRGSGPEPACSSPCSIPPRFPT